MKKQLGSTVDEAGNPAKIGELNSDAANDMMMAEKEQRVAKLSLKILGLLEEMAAQQYSC